MTRFAWPLAISRFTLADRLKIGWRILRAHQMTAGPMVRRYEELWEDYTGSPHAIMVSSGSDAVELLALRRREQLIAAGEWPGRNKVVFPVCNWVTSVAPWIRLGFEPVWVDVGWNLCASVDAITPLLARDNASAIGTVFYVTLLGQGTYLRELRTVCEKYGVVLMLDNCESPFSACPRWFDAPAQHFCTLGLSCTSLHFSHPATTGTEGGMIFAADAGTADWFRMMRNHGLTRGMDAHYRNPEAHPAFDFHLMGVNARSTDLQAYMGLLDWQRSLDFIPKRIRLANLFYRSLADNYCDISRSGSETPLMALPIVPHPTQRLAQRNLRAMLDSMGIEHRPVVGGNLLRHTAFKAYGDPLAYPHADWIHHQGLYVGLHSGVTSDMILQLASRLNDAR